MLDTKLKKWSKKQIGRILWSVGLILCLVGSGCFLVAGNYWQNEIREGDTREAYCIEELYGNKELQETIKEELKNTIQVAFDIGMADEKEYQSRQQEWESKLTDKKGMLAARILVNKKKKDKDYTDDFGTLDLGEKIESYPIYINYDGYRQEYQYNRTWANYYKDDIMKKNISYGNKNEDMDNADGFLWLEANTLIGELCADNWDYANHVGQALEEDFEMYGESLRPCIDYVYSHQPEGYEKIPDSVMQKLDGETNCKMRAFEKNAAKYPEETQFGIYVSQGVPYGHVHDYDSFDEYIDSDDFALSYDNSHGLYYSKAIDKYYCVELDLWLSKDTEKEDLFHSYWNPGEEDMALYHERYYIGRYGVSDKEYLKELGHSEEEGDYKVKDITNLVNNQSQQEEVKFSDAEREILAKVFARAIYDNDRLEDINLQICVPIACVLGNPNRYAVSVALTQRGYDELQAQYVSGVSSNREQQQKLVERRDLAEWFSLGLMIVAFLLAVVRCLMCAAQTKKEDIVQGWLDQWNSFFIAFLLFGCTGISICTWQLFVAELQECSVTAGATVIIKFVSYYGGFVCASYVAFQCLLSIIRKTKRRVLLHNTFLERIMKWEQNALYHGKLTVHVLVIAVIVPAIWILGALFMIQGGLEDVFILWCMLAVILWGILLIFLYRYSGRLTQIRDGVKRIQAGDIKYQLPTDESMSPLNQFAKDINRISEGLDRAVDDMLRSERLKTELISNVSHDIKTPLTSIITYVDLLKREDLQPDKAVEYVEVLDQKSQRLKILTDDLFEAAKATSGAMATEIMKIDLGALISQALGEFEEKLEKTGLEVKNAVPEQGIYVMADGRLAWRILENMLGNVTKYALSGSRVYIDITEQESEIMLIMKNISAYALNISAEELMERFTRGDRSRNTEGSGLGLNIAKSLAELQGGRFYVEIDGDLFKAVLHLPKAEK